jgi:geranylgeranyl diphosphate synthase, type II
MDASEHRDFVEQLLSRYRHATLDRILTLIPDKEPRRYLYSSIRDYVQRGGKGIRPAICIATCVALGGSIAKALNSAAAIELFHNAALTHDDVEDGSTLRRGEATLNAELGNALAMNTGDALNILAIQSLLANAQDQDIKLSKRLLHEFSAMAMETVEGQALELGWIRDNVLGLEQDDYLRLVLKKTCCYTCIYPLRIGALVSGNESIDVDSLNELGLYIGVAFQIRDDWLSLCGDRARFGKEIFADIWEGKRTLMLMHLLAHCPPDDRQWIEAFFRTPRSSRSAEVIRRIFDTMQRCGSLSYAEEAARHFSARAHHEYERIFGQMPENEETRFIRELITYVGERDS